MTTKRTVALSLLFVPAVLLAQPQDTRTFYYPKPVTRMPWQPPMKPVTRLADVKAKHKGERAWRELVIHDENSRAFLVQEPAGARRERRLFPDSSLPRSFSSLFSEGRHRASASSSPAASAAPSATPTA